MSKFQTWNYSVFLFLPLLHNPGAGESLVQNTRIWGIDFWLCLKSTELDGQNSGKNDCNYSFHWSGRVLCLTFFLFNSSGGNKSNEPQERNREATY